ncbi:hypothetical protein [Mycobacterium sp. NPDC050853]|uniref:hypothetical protein n=1 Tax=Mycobacterium sp. NPDC050853 TaxID=3155160 RepID=UPI0033DA2F29
MRFAVKDESATIPLGEEPGRAQMQLGHLVRTIGDDSLFIILFKWPDNVSKFEYAEPEDNFLQSTGTQSGLTVEFMRDGRLFTLGHKGGDTQPLQLLRQDGTAVEVNANEVLSPDEAVALFTEYSSTNALDTALWSLREITLDSEDADETSQASASTGTSETSTSAASVQSDTAEQTNVAADEDRRERGSST